MRRGVFGCRARAGRRAGRSFSAKARRAARMSWLVAFGAPGIMTAIMARGSAARGPRAASRKRSRASSAWPSSKSACARLCLTSWRRWVGGERGSIEAGGIGEFAQGFGVLALRAQSLAEGRERIGM